MASSIPRRSFAACSLSALSALSACGSSPQVAPIYLSGFLGDYSGLRLVQEQEGVMNFTKEDVWWISYDRLIIDRPLVHLREDAAGQELDPARLEDLADFFHAQLVSAVADAYPVVEEPGPTVLRLRSAITDVVPGERLQEIGGASIEAEILDSMNGERLGAVVSRKSGERAVITSFADAERAFGEWAAALRAWLDRTHGREPR